MFRLKLGIILSIPEIYSSRHTEYNAFKYVVGIATRLRAGRSGVRILVGARNVSLRYQGPGRLWDPPSAMSYLLDTEFFSGVKRPGHDVNH